MRLWRGMYGNDFVRLLRDDNRTFWRFLEANPILIGALPAALLIFFSKSHRRLGDYAAKTLVVYEGM